MAGGDNDQTFWSGVIEGFYNRPWTKVQRLDLFKKLHKFGLNSYLYGKYCVDKIELQNFHYLVPTLPRTPPPVPKHPQCINNFMTFCDICYNVCDSVSFINF